MSTSVWVGVLITEKLWMHEANKSRVDRRSPVSWQALLTHTATVPCENFTLCWCCLDCVYFPYSLDFFKGAPWLFSCHSSVAFCWNVEVHPFLKGNASRTWCWLGKDLRQVVIEIFGRSNGYLSLKFSKSTATPGTPFPTPFEKCVGSFMSGRNVNNAELWDGASGLLFLS